MNKDQKSLDATQALGGALYVVALPIGNTDDLSPRARHILGLVDIVAAEDTRTFQEFASESKISFKKLLAYHDHNEQGSSQGLLSELFAGKSVALVSDAGTPNISDPGFHLLNVCFENKIPVIGLPGPSALTLALSVCPIGGGTHFFGGFLPSKSSDRKKIFQDKSKSADRIVFFESPHRILEHLQDAADIFEGKVFIFREATKKFEEILYLEIDEALAHFKKHTPKGEFVVIYPGQSDELLTREELKNEIQNLVAQNLKPSEVLKRVSDLTDLARREIYDLITEVKHKTKDSDTDD